MAGHQLGGLRVPVHGQLRATSRTVASLNPTSYPSVVTALAHVGGDAGTTDSGEPAVKLSESNTVEVGVTHASNAAAEHAGRRNVSSGIIRSLHPAAVGASASCGHVSTLTQFCWFSVVVVNGTGP